MKFKSLILAAAGLLALACAADPPISPHYATRGAITTPRAGTTVIGDISVNNRDLDPCKLNCDLPWKKCVKECGGGGSCEHQCNCELFSNSNELCRLRKCVQPPTECPATKRDTQEQPATVIQDFSSDSPFLTDDGLPKPNGVGSWPLQHCYYCMGTIWSCLRECTNPGTCDDTCNCFALKVNSKMCNGCDIACNCGHTCPRSEFFQPDPDGSAKRDIQAGPPVNPCVLCQYSINACKKKCANSGACDDTCNCYAQLHNRNCKNCKLPRCSCGHTCPRLESLQRRLAIGARSDLPNAPDALSVDKDEAADMPLEDDGSKVQSGITPAMPFTPGTTCLKALNKCKAACANPPACDDTCNCHYRGSRDCKSVRIPECKCGHTCPNLPWH